MENKCSFSEFMKKLRQDNGLTQEKIAEIAGVNTLTVIRWENEKIKFPRCAAIEAIEKHFEINIENFVDKDITRTKEKRNAKRGKAVRTLTEVEPSEPLKLFDFSCPVDTTVADYVANDLKKSLYNIKKNNLVKD